MSILLGSESIKSVRWTLIYPGSYHKTTDRAQELDKQNGNADLLTLEKVKEALSPMGVEFKEIESNPNRDPRIFPRGYGNRTLRERIRPTTSTRKYSRCP